MRNLQFSSFNILQQLAVPNIEKKCHYFTDLRLYNQSHQIMQHHFHEDSNCVILFNVEAMLTEFVLNTERLNCTGIILVFVEFNPLNAELNPIYYLLALLGAHHFLHISRIRVKSLILRLLMSYIYGAPILDVSRSHTTTHHIR